MTENNEEPLSTKKRYKAIHEQAGRRAMVVAHFLDEQGRRCTQFVAICNSTLRDCNADAELIAKAFNEQVAAGASPALKEPKT